MTTSDFQAMATVFLNSKPGVLHSASSDTARIAWQYGMDTWRRGAWEFCRVFDGRRGFDRSSFLAACGYEP